MSRAGEVLYKAAFIGRWYFWYNLELVFLQAVLPQGRVLWPQGILAAEAGALDRRRGTAQLAIYSHIRNYGSVCAACGACCKEKVNRFTAFDAAVRTGGPMPLRHFGKDILSLPWILANGLKHSAQRLWRIALRKPEPPVDLCEHLGTSGCTLAHAERPMLCASWFCPKYLWHMETNDLKALGPLLKEMEGLHYQAARLMRKGSK